MLWAAQTEAHTKKAGPLFYNNKPFFFIVLQGVANSESRIIFKHTVDYGKQSDGGTHSLLLLYTTSWKTVNLPYQSL